MKFPIQSILLTLVCGIVPSFAEESLRAEIEQLKRQIAAQQQQIDQLRRMLDGQRTPDAAASALPAVPRVDRPPASDPPFSIELGRVSIAPTGFLDFSQVWRSKAVSSGLPTNFAAIPFNNTVDGRRTQTLSSAANSRFGVQVSTTLAGARLLGIVETDFLGYQPGNITTTTNSYGLRLRLAFADVQAGKWEVLAGQAWSLLTPGWKGIPALPSGLLLTQDLDPNLQSGLVWSRAPQARAVYRPTRGVALGVAIESGSTYVGGSGGAGPITLPSSLSPDYFKQVDSGSGGLGIPNERADLIAKVALDQKAWGRNLHLEFAGLLNQFSFFNPLTTEHFSIVGGGGSLNAAMDVTRKLRVATANFYSNGGGRLIFGEAPALIIQGNGAPSLIHSMSTLEAIEYQATPKTKLWMYYGGTYISRSVTIDPSNGKAVGYGYVGSPDTQNRSIQQITAGLTRVFWSHPSHGSLQFSGQYSWLVRHPWYVAAGSPASANLNMMYLGFRYVLPAAPPTPGASAAANRN